MTTTRKTTRRTPAKATRTVRYVYICKHEVAHPKAKRASETALFVLEKASNVKEIISLFAEGMTVVVFRHQLTVTEIAVVVAIIVALAMVKVHVKK